MKKIFPILILLCLITTMGWSQNYRERVRQNVISKLRFYFIEDPTRPFPRPNVLMTYEVNKRAIANNQSITGALWTDANNAGLKDLLIKILRDPAQGGDFELQEKINTVLLITNKQVIVFLYADFNNPTFHPSWRRWAPYCVGGDSYVAAHNKASWPCASHRGTRYLAGDIGLGAFFYHSSYTGFTPVQKRSTIIHELTHTQLKGGEVVYGPDENHYASELIPSLNSAFDEGLANAFAFLYDFPANNNLTTWLNNNKKLFVETWPDCSGNQCLQTRLASASVSTQTCPDNTINGARCYNIRDIPPELLLYCETTSANILYQYMKQFRNGNLLLVHDIKRVKNRMERSDNQFGILFKQMVRRGMNFSLPYARTGTVTHGQHLPLGILDYYTGYRMNSKVSLGRIIGSNWTNADTNIEDYFSASNQRNRLLGYRTNTTDWHVNRQISRFARHLNVRPAQEASSSGGGN